MTSTIPDAPRLVVAGTAGDSGKTLVSLALTVAARRAGLEVRTFKKGPDYIDAAWLALVSGHPCRNLDTYLVPEGRLLETFAAGAGAGLSLVEGNRGLHDGFDLEGTHSTAALARLLGAPVVLVVSAAKVTRTVAAVVLGMKVLDPEVRIGGVVLNRTAGSRHERLARSAVEALAGVPVLGAIPRLDEDPLPGRHLGLVPPEEHPEAARIEETLAARVAPCLDLDRLLELARSAGPAPHGATPPSASPRSRATSGRVRIAVFRDSAFTFYYPENLEALEAAGAELVALSPLEAVRLPERIGGLYIGGGFPETHATRLAANRALAGDLRAAAEAGLPIYAECGGLIFLARSLVASGERHEMAGVLPVDLELFAAPQGHGYMELRVDQPNPFFALGEELRAHEFHYTRVTGGADAVRTAYEVRRGAGISRGRDGIVVGNVLASYAHLHAGSAPVWARNFVERAGELRVES
jgi:cobyrinic acid a,c-diamide synthase